MGRDMMRLRRGILLNTPHEEQASGAVASFATDIGKLKECVVEIEPVQDLHGYDSPWPPGGGKNLLELYRARTSYNGIDFSLTTDGKIHAQGTNSSGSTSYSGGDYSTYDGCPWHFPAGTYTISCTVPRSNTEIGTVSFMLRRQSDNGQQTYNQLKNGSSTFTIDEPFGAWFWFSVLNGKTVDIDVGLQLEKGSTATSWTPYENICPISGWSEANVYDDPKYDKTVWWNQQCAANNAVASYSKFGLTATAVQGKFAFDISGTYSYSSGDRNMYIFNMQNANVLTAGHKYIVTNNSPYFCVYVYGAGSPSASVSGNRVNVANQGGAILTCTASGQYRISLHCGTNIPNNTQINETVYINLFDLTAMFGAGNEPSTVDEFKALFPNDYYAYNAGEETLVSAVNGEPYRAIIVDLDGTRYGGTLDVLAGVLRVTHEVDIFDSSYNFKTWGVNYRKNGITGFYLYFTQPDLSTFKQCDVLPVINSIWGGYAVGAWNNTTNPNSTYYMFCFPNTTLGIADGDNNQAAISKLLTYLNDNPISVCKTLADPFDVQLTPAQLRAIKGQNNIFADCGDVAVKYWKH